MMLMTDPASFLGGYFFRQGDRVYIEGKGVPPGIQIKHDTYCKHSEKLFSYEVEGWETKVVFAETHTEKIWFEQSVRDSHGCFDHKNKYFTFPMSKMYEVRKYFKAGDVIENPESVRSL